MPNTLVPGPRQTLFAKMDVARKEESKKDDSKNDSDNKTGDNESKSNNNNNNNNSNNNDGESKSESKSEENKEVPFVGIYPSEEVGCLANLFLSDGQQGPALYLKVGKRKADKGLSLSQCIREALCDYRTANKVKDQIGMGGIFKVE